MTSVSIDDAVAQPPLDSPMSNVLVLIGTRPEAIKMFPIVHALRRSAWFNPVVVITGQHRDLVTPILELAGIVPDHDLDVGRPGIGLNGMVASVIVQLDEFCRGRFGATGASVTTRSAIREEGFPAAALVHGDTSSALASALAAFHLRIPVCHVEAGLRTWSTLTPFPEELNRQLISRIAAFHLAPTSVNGENLVREGVRYEQIFVTGNTGIDALRYAATVDVRFADPSVRAAIESGRPLVVVTAHRRENWNGGLGRIAEAVHLLSLSRPDAIFVVPLHPNPLVQAQLGEPLTGLANVVLTEPLAYAEFARLMSRAAVVLTDSGGIQEEAPALGVPVLVARDSTERGEGVSAGTLSLVGTDIGRIVAGVGTILDDPSAYVLDPEVNPYGDGRAADRIVAAFDNLAGIGPAPVRFGSGFSRTLVLEAAGYPVGLLTAPAGERGIQPDRGEEYDRWVGR